VSRHRPRRGIQTRRSFFLGPIPPKLPEDFQGPLENPAAWANFRRELDVFQEDNLRSWRNALLGTKCAEALGWAAVAFGLAWADREVWWVTILVCLPGVVAILISALRSPKNLVSYLEADNTFWAGPVPWPLCPRDLYVRDIRYRNNEKGMVIRDDEEPTDE
jgi:hypothetical protein